MTHSEVERIAVVEAKVDTIVLELGVIKNDVRQLLVRDIERAVIGRYVGRISKAVPWAALVTSLIAVLTK